MDTTARQTSVDPGSAPLCDPGQDTCLNFSFLIHKTRISLVLFHSILGKIKCHHVDETLRRLPGTQSILDLREHCHYYSTDWTTTTWRSPVRAAPRKLSKAKPALITPRSQCSQFLAQCLRWPRDPCWASFVSITQHPARRSRWGWRNRKIRQSRLLKPLGSHLEGARAWPGAVSIPEESTAQARGPQCWMRRRTRVQDQLGRSKNEASDLREFGPVLSQPVRQTRMICLRRGSGLRCLMGRMRA